MELKEFVSQTLIQIVNDAIEAQQQVNSTGARINPRSGKGSKELQYGTTFDNQIISSVEFDVALTINEDANLKGKAGITVFKTGVGIESGIKEINSTVNRIKFSILIALPIYKKDEGE